MGNTGGSQSVSRVRTLRSSLSSRSASLHEPKVQQGALSHNTQGGVSLEVGL